MLIAVEQPGRGWLVARAFWPSEPDLKAGAGTGLVWIVALFLVGGVALLPSLIAGRFTFRWAPTDAAVIVLTALVAISARRGVDWRIAINLAWEWVAIGMAYLLFRNLPRSRAESSALALALAATAAAVSAYGLFQAGVELPELQAAYRRNPALILARMGIQPGTQGQQAFEHRLIGSNDVYSTFALANSLAGFLVGPLVLILGLTLLAYLFLEPIVSLMAPYLRGRARQLFDDLVSGKLPKREFYDYLPPREGAAGTGAEVDE